MAKRAHQTCGQVFEYTMAHGLCERTPVKDVRPSAFLKSRGETNFARVEAKELPELLRKIDGYGIDQKGSEITRLALRLMAYVFVRTSEWIGVRWDEVDMDAKEWRIPPESMKMKTPHIIFLSDQALSDYMKSQAVESWYFPRLVVLRKI